MKRVILSMMLVAGLSAFSSLQAQYQSGRDGSKRMPSELRLTDSQRKEMDKINADFKKDLEKINNSKLTAQERRDKLSKLRDEKKDAKDKVFTAEQKEYFNKNNGKDRAQRYAQGNGRKNSKVKYHRGNSARHHRHYEGCCIEQRGSRNMNCPLQRECFRGDRMQNDNCPIASNLDLSDAQKEQVKKLREENRKDREEMREKHRAAMEKILTPAQIEKIKQ